MTTPTGTITLQDVDNEFGGVAPISINEYYALASGIPASGEISMNQLRGKQFLVLETLTSSQTWTPKANLATYIHIFCFGAGGSGGSSEPDTSGITTGNCSSSGGAAGGYSYSKIAASAAGSSTVVIGAGGVGVISGWNSKKDGNAGSASRFTGSGVTMVSNGGSAGRGAYSSTAGGDTSNAPAAAGGTATGGNQVNKQGGDSGSAICTSNRGTSASGGGGPEVDSNSGNSSAATSNVATSGNLFSNNGSWPTYMSSYISGRGETPIIQASNTSFDGSSGVRNLASGLSSGSPTYCGGSGGASGGSGRTSGRGGNGVVFIVYEI